MNAHVAVLAYNLMDLEDWKDEHPELAEVVIGVPLENVPASKLEGLIITSYCYTNASVDHPEFSRARECVDRAVTRMDSNRNRLEANRFVRAAADRGDL